MSDRREEEVKTITFGSKKEIDPAEEEAYKARIAEAKKKGVNKLKGSTPVGGIERPIMPDLTRKGRLDDVSGMTAEGGVTPRPPGSPVLSSQTVQQMEAMQKAQAQAQTQSSAEAEMKKEVEDKKDELLDLFDFMAQDEASKILNNKKRRSDIESRLQPMDFEDLLMKGYVEQTIPIIPGKYEPRFRSLRPSESLFIKAFLAKDENAPSDAYAAEKYSMCQLACALVSMNGKSYPDHRNQKGEPDPELFQIKLKQLLEQSVYIIADLGINYLWFDIRVRRLISPEKLGNG